MTPLTISSRAIAMAIALGSIPATALAQSTASDRSAKDANVSLPEPPENGTPGGDPTPGATRPESSCALDPQQPELTALYANRGHDVTAFEQPTFWFYVPLAREQVAGAQFVLLNATERKTLHRHREIAVPNAPGFFSVTLPPEVGLEAGGLYRWYFLLDCAPDRTEDPDLVVSGWVRRMLGNRFPMGGPLDNPSNDAIAEIAERLAAEPDDPSHQQSWMELLETLGRAELIGVPFIGME
ncbi:protein of unknown function (DUF928) [Rubidibacter lacunae KORDI 51-2]|uniref:DUF928 domain-containing protein n=1 Tax=Rubidibacter lacunae KORDI 51-2 TaxID=582515 RepID=U5DBX4_9CHRO|nr:DUF928 domain-containing protein [Rubidibacter lacunae]ERN42028.1 protein of unknown function (DUF928) [Rubidibacter lacunae KORDI 51-2]